MAIKAGYKENMSGPSRIPKPMPYEDEETLLEGKYNIGSPGQAAVLQERQVRGVGRARKKRNRIEKDVIDNSAVKKVHLLGFCFNLFRCDGYLFLLAILPIRAAMPILFQFQPRYIL